MLSAFYMEHATKQQRRFKDKVTQIANKHFYDCSRMATALKEVPSAASFLLGNWRGEVGSGTRSLSRS